LDSYTLRKEHVLNEAIASGKFGEDRRGFWSQQYDRDPAGTERTLDALVSATEGQPPYPPELFPHLFSQRRHPQMRSASVAATVPTPQPPPSAEVVDEAVAGWTRQLFPETRAVAGGRVVRCND
jgi:hypothetical protein